MSQRVRPASVLVSIRVLWVKRHQASSSAPRSPSLLAIARRSPGEVRRSAAISSGSSPEENVLVPASSSTCALVVMRNATILGEPNPIGAGILCLSGRTYETQSDRRCPAIPDRLRAVLRLPPAGRRQPDHRRRQPCPRSRPAHPQGHLDFRPSVLHRLHVVATEPMEAAADLYRPSRWIRRAALLGRQDGGWRRLPAAE